MICNRLSLKNTAHVSRNIKFLRNYEDLWHSTKMQVACFIDLKTYKPFRETFKILRNVSSENVFWKFMRSFQTCELQLQSLKFSIWRKYFMIWIINDKFPDSFVHIVVFFVIFHITRWNLWCGTIWYFGRTEELMHHTHLISHMRWFFSLLWKWKCSSKLGKFWMHSVIKL